MSSIYQFKDSAVKNKANICVLTCFNSFRVDLQFAFCDRIWFQCLEAAPLAGRSLTSTATCSALKTECPGHQLGTLAKGEVETC